MTTAEPSPDLRQVVVPVADIRDDPEGARQRQLLFGETVEVQGEAPGWVAVQAQRDGYRGVMRSDHLGPARRPTHRVAALATHLYSAPDIKSPEVASLSFGAQLTIVASAGAFLVTDAGLHVPEVHVVSAARQFRDPAGVAEMFLGTPYLWGGNSRLGIDCSGLVQAACLACGIPCPGDSGDQSRAAGVPVADHLPLARGDLLFWKGHVAMAVGPDRLVHANAHHMAVAYEPAEAAVRRIAGQGGGGVVARRRLVLD